MNMSFYSTRGSIMKALFLLLNYVRQRGLSEKSIGL